MYPDTSNRPDRVEWDGRIFYAIDRPSGATYWVAADATALHRSVFEHAHGPVPDGMVVHHADHQSWNNDPANLVATTRTEHGRAHTEERLQDPAYAAQLVEWFELGKDAARAWHSSDEGRAWHSQHARDGWSLDARARRRRDVVCDCCGAQFEAYFDRARWCSGACRVRGNTPPGEPQPCQECGTVYTPRSKYSPGKFCSKRCSGKAARRAR